MFDLTTKTEQQPLLNPIQTQLPETSRERMGEVEALPRQHHQRIRESRSY